MTDPEPAEFALIARHFRPLAASTPGALALSDDAALLDPPAGRTLVLAADAMVAGVHFLPDDPPETIGRKLLRVNLSDLAAMGATPLGYLMTTALSRETGDAWLGAFSRGLAEDQALYGCGLLGGDTVSTTGPVTLSLTIIGSVAEGGALRRNGAREGDALWVSGTIGDGALGLLALTGRLAALSDGARATLGARYRLPQPRLSLGAELGGIATACMDVSDGLVQDVGHLARAAGLGAEIEAADVPLSEAAKEAVAADPSLLARCLSGGDDYELVFAAPEEKADAVIAAAVRARVAVRRIGRFVAGQGVHVTGTDGAPMPFSRGGWSHVA
ncbi:thiamine-phosphate kinase [Elioraea sp.]|uniref:thiamine-phosphate kinase n=1 Tax=Elioraea sp. TaxID=2185103 RepID=UPI0025C42D2A|nr:thiamine-phosphate kinase [Elioraea sp.]